MIKESLNAGATKIVLNGQTIKQEDFEALLEYTARTHIDSLQAFQLSKIRAKGNPCPAL